MARQKTSLSLCGCCEGIERLTPAPLENRPSLSDLAYRIGTHGRFKESMQAALSEHPALRKITRDTGDPTMALFDGWATVLDVLTFYQEQIANEGFIRCARERRSVLELARRIGYELAPGVAAETHLAFELETAAQAPRSVKIASGTMVQSMPGQDEVPQTFETVEEIEARPEWNALKPRLREAQAIEQDTAVVWIEGVANNLKPGDPLLFVGEERRKGEASEHWDLRRAKQIDLDRESKLTKVILDRGLGDAFTPPGTDIRLFALRRRASLFGYNAPQLDAMPDEIKDTLGTPETSPPVEREWKKFSISGIADTGEDETIYLDAVYPEILANSWVVLELPKEVELYEVETVDESSRVGFTLTSKSTKLKLMGEDLEEKFDKMVRETAVFAQSEQLTIAERPLRENDADAVLVPIEGKQIVLDQLLGGSGQAVDAMRARALVNLDLRDGSEEIEIEKGSELEVLGVGEAGAEYTVRTEDGAEVTAQAEKFLLFPAHEFVTGLRPGKSLIVSGKRLRATPGKAALVLTGDKGEKRSIEPGERLLILKRPAELAASEDLRFRLRTDDGFEGELDAAPDKLTYLPALKDDGTVAEHATIDAARPEFGKTALTLTEALDYIYDRTSVVINANVARSTHGKSKRSEVLGSGNGSETFRKFTLSEKPLTHIQATTASGTATTLNVRVDSVLWEEVPNFFASGPDDRAFTSRRADDGTVTVQFGDGITGSRLPTGIENVTADYRVGIGLPGLLKAGQLKLLMTQPLGVKSVVNPLAPRVAEDPESLDDAREVAPSTVLTLDRVVSLQDYEDFARAFAGVSKALATELWQGEQRLIHLTVAGSAGDDPPVDKLIAAIDAQRHAKDRIIVEPYAAISFSVKVRVITDSAHIAANVLASVEARLLEQFSFGHRVFGQGVTASEVIAAAQEVEGVVAIDLDLLNDLDPFLRPNVNADIARSQPGADPPTLPADLLTINPDKIRILELKD